jgi:hypothetical protein
MMDESSNPDVVMDEKDEDASKDTSLLTSWNSDDDLKDTSSLEKKQQTIDDLVAYVNDLYEAHMHPKDIMIDILYLEINNVFITTFPNIEAVASQYQFPSDVILNYLSVLFDTKVFDHNSLLGILDKQRITSYILCFHELFRPYHPDVK